MANTLRISGLASGMDIDKIVSDLMKAERMPLDKLKQKKQLLEWQRDDYRAMNTLLQGLDDYLFSNITLQSSMLKKTVSSSNESVVTATAASSAANVATTMQVNQVATSAVWLSDATKRVDKASFSVDADVTLTINVTNGDGTTKQAAMTVKKGTTLDGVIAQLNSNLDLGVSAFYDEQTGRVSIMKKEMGAQASLVLADQATVDFFAQLGFTNTAAGQELTGKTAGKDADITINGLQTTRSSNTFTINGVTYTVKGTGAATVSVATDVDAMFNAIKGFVDKYNETIDKINAKLKEERYRDYPPLTDEQKEAMTEKQIELWEEKAKSGMLRGDSILSSALSKMRMNVYTKVEGANIPSGFSQLAQIGITTSSNYLDGGKLIIDETKLREKIKENPDAVYQLFNQDGATDAEKGIARRLRDTIKATIGKIEQKAGKTIWTNQQFAIGRDLIQINDQIDRFQDRLKQIEDRYYRQFTAMEEAIQRANQQSMYLMNAFGGGMQG
ncbi:Flagellar hook-associated 2 domain protein [Geobacillus thermoleovorans CCB_US3_UF5]|uniref:Flagellar hook-associated protein 2 n=2 Tax=Geobacillus thermoleovorans group TaxID=1505648 RepID=U2YA44_GEOKU|nr:MULTISPECIES: flagellar hook-associated protein 2 [Geobacillus]AEV20791.1 Flagellar hook-associated 2 domain protein [Geobacillus thermoleovorans CCB_US3_UF5]EQB96911.1 flagellar cap protein FliD [Geobacillus sp. A8]ODA15481.1 flagellar cap protein FliD [Geobacillus thermoleovorans]OQP14440.1 flagellar cap protein FliD [Geobacillus thermoleovorans]QDY74639.1 flagellar hook-associated protein 2 [Geobacillus thermoleovorans]